jgi:hypothetical protein
MASDVATESTAHRWSHALRIAICSAVFAFRGSLAGRASQALMRAGRRLVEPRQKTVIRGRLQALEREVTLVLEDLDRVRTAGELHAVVDPSGIIRLLQASRTSRRPGPVVAVIDPAWSKG